MKENVLEGNLGDFSGLELTEGCCTEIIGSGNVDDGTGFLYFQTLITWYSR